jgi:lipopolysaccharide/colanic/teichoic acid biosynthesis glycosyltransferase
VSNVVKTKKKFYRDHSKRWIDVVLAFTALLLLCPIIIVSYILLSIVNGKAGVFFFQQRPGKNGNLFRIIKFKTMNDRRDANGMLLHDAERLTRVGRLVRSTSIDELPQLWNVLRGDMSLIGPRPLLPQYMPLYNVEQARRHEVRPGITGWAQCHGRNAISWTEKFKLDVWYVDNVSLWVDIKIIFITLKKVFAQEGINETGQATMEAFNGTN